MPTYSYSDGVSVSSGMPPTYVTVDEGDEYFRWSLNSAAWDDASNDDKSKAIVTATRAIDRLNFSGLRTSDWTRFLCIGPETGLVTTLDPGSDSPPPGNPSSSPGTGRRRSPRTSRTRLARSPSRSTGSTRRWR